MAKGKPTGFIQAANAERAAEQGIKNIMARLKAGYMQPGGYRNKAYMDADHRMLTIYLNR
jgi:hypothetical protein